MSKQKSLSSPRALDHLVLPVGSLAAARARLGSLGFTVASDARHPFGTENACVFFSDGTYLEPLGVASREAFEASVAAGNVFVARDRAFRFRRGEDGLSAIVLGTNDAGADHARFRKAGCSGGDPLEFSRPFRLPDGSSAEASFRLAFAADMRAPDFFLFCCERTSERPAIAPDLLSHANGVTGIARVVLVEDNPSDFQIFLQDVIEQREATAHSFGVDIDTGNSVISVLTPAGLDAWFGLQAGAERGLRGAAVVFRTQKLEAVEALFRRNDIIYEHRHHRILVRPAPGQGVVFAFEE
ncbi:VOC family protein [Rhizobiaceae bacterium BDR2-2]|uniref:VOC family protein n=1 Tax=Ectorhizobium quercum TaxID=2965071 RepID=A0AAE3SVK7_9HYPH|nr:VOC family protein [Ectorhizobium quercum]MCX8997778.1 VOC family protein [Ectorhizobium quercum]